MSQRIDSDLKELNDRIALLRQLLSDPLMVTIAKKYLFPKASQDDTSVAPPLQERKPRRQRNPRRKHGALIRATADIVKGSLMPISAKDVTSKLEQSGFQFDAENKQVAVSKALRALAKKGKIEAQKNGHGPKAPLFYSKNGANLFPVQETTH
jgi:hypothetical protein